jgi:DNA integrity scanning protein DisA with diadenylate cyclase activity
MDLTWQGGRDMNCAATQYSLHHPTKVADFSKSGLEPIAAIRLSGLRQLANIQGRESASLAIYYISLLHPFQSQSTLRLSSWRKATMTVRRAETTISIGAMIVTPMSSPKSYISVRPAGALCFVLNVGKRKRHISRRGRAPQDSKLQCTSKRSSQLSN